MFLNRFQNYQYLEKVVIKIQNKTNFISKIVSNTKSIENTIQEDSLFQFLNHH